MDDTSNQAKFQLDYYNSTANRVVFPPAQKETVYRVALGFWLIPLVVGVCNFLCWFILRWGFLKTFGQIIVATGFASGGVSLCCGGYFLIDRLRKRARLWSEALMPIIGLLFLLFFSLLLTVALCSVAYGSDHW